MRNRVVLGGLRYWGTGVIVAGTLLGGTGAGATTVRIDLTDVRLDSPSGEAYALHGAFTVDVIASAGASDAGVLFKRSPRAHADVTGAGGRYDSDGASEVIMIDRNGGAGEADMRNVGVSRPLSEAGGPVMAHSVLLDFAGSDVDLIRSIDAGDSMEITLKSAEEVLAFSGDGSGRTIFETYGYGAETAANRVTITGLSNIAATVVATPLPMTGLLLAAGMGAFGLAARRRNHVG